MSIAISAANVKAWPARRQRMKRARYACPMCKTRFTWDQLLTGPKTPIHPDPSLAADCRGVGQCLEKAR